MTDCNHPTEKIARLDPNGVHVDAEAMEVEMWAKCECGEAITVQMDITDVLEDNGKGPTYSGVI